MLNYKNLQHFTLILINLNNFFRSILKWTTGGKVDNVLALKAAAQVRFPVESLHLSIAS